MSALTKARLSPSMSPQDVRVNDVGYTRETDHEQTIWKNCCKLTHYEIDDGHAKMSMALQT
jgi:hypothetical protein